MKILRKFTSKTLFLLISGGACAALYLWRRGGNAPPALLASDALTLLATLFLSIFALTKISRSGFFDTLTYSLSYAARRLTPLWRRGESFDEYLARKKEEAVTKDSPLPLLVAGIIFLFGAVALTAVFYSSSTDTTPGI